MAERREPGLGGRTGVIDMGHGRYDIYGAALERSAAFDVIVEEPPPLLAAIAKSLFDVGYGIGDVGGLPTSYDAAAEVVDAGGMWHRDAYSLWEEEALDLQAPWFYITALLPLSDLGEGEGATEVVLGAI
jgi:hypothetical protein